MHSRKACRALILLGLSLGILPDAVAKDQTQQGADASRWHYSQQTRTYERSGPGPEAALYARLARPSLGAAMSFIEDRNLALEMRLLLSTDSQEALERFGPWLNDQGLSDNGHVLIHRIEEIGTHGLPPERYGLTKLLHLRDLLNRLLLDPSISEGRSRAIRSVLSSAFDDAFKTLASDLGRGAVEARQIQSRLFREPPSVDAESLLDELSTGKRDVAEALEMLVPGHPDYTALTRHMSRLMTQQRAVSPSLTDNVAGQTVASSTAQTSSAKLPRSERITIGQRSSVVFDVKKLLVQAGDLPENTVITPRFDAYLLVALKKVQSRHGLEPNGELDSRTLASVRLTVEEQIERVAMSLERLRWMPRDRGQRHVIVNLPSYRLQLVQDDTPILDMPVVIGSTEHPTPAFSQDLSYIEFNPTWTVPRSIAEAELLPREAANPGYLKERDFHFLLREDGQWVDVPYDSVTAEQLEERPFPYTLRQRGGAQNALGRMKFMMPNPYSIYLHDTLAKRHFGLTDRAYSHGCIRLSDPDQLARTMLGLDAMPQSKLSRILSSSRTQRSRLRQTVPTHLTYLTTWVGGDDRLHHAPDIYKHDPALKQALQALRDDGALGKPDDPLRFAVRPTRRAANPVDYELADSEGP